MARLVSYKARDENRYSTFGGEVRNNSNENLTETYRARLLPKKKTKLKSKKTNTTNKKQPETMPTISASIEQHRNKIAQSRTINASSDITRGRRRNRSPETSSRFKCCFNSKCCTQDDNWRCNKWCCCWSKCCARFCCGCINYDDSENDDDDDIDAKVEQYKYEMRLKELKRGDTDVVNQSQETNFQSNSYRLATNTPKTLHSNENAINDNGKIATATKPTSIIFRYRKYWNWNDSLRSNSDKFLETLEYDMDGEQSWKRTNNRTDASVQIKGFLLFPPDFARLRGIFFSCMLLLIAMPNTVTCLRYTKPKPFFLSNYIRLFHTMLLLH